MGKYEIQVLPRAFNATAVWYAAGIICYHAAFARPSFRFLGNQVVITGRISDFTRYPVFYRQR
jgi:hypothetical protein